MKILCVDDEPEILDLLGEFLQMLGHNVVLAKNGQEGWQLFAAAPESFDLLITDERMPGMSGLELIGRIRAQGNTLPVIVASGHMGDELDKSATDLQVAAIIPKPFRLAEFQEIIASLEG